MIKLVVFDWNGTIIADTTISLNANNKVLKAFGAKPVDMKTYKKTIIIPQIEFYVKHGCSRKELLSNNAKREKVFHEYFDYKSSFCRSRKNAKKILEWLSNNSMNSILLSNHTVVGI